MCQCSPGKLKSKVILAVFEQYPDAHGLFFMLQVYDRVLPGRSVPTLIALIAPVTLPLWA